MSDFLDQLARVRAGHVLDVKAPPVEAEKLSDEAIAEGIRLRHRVNPAKLYAELVGVAEIAERLNVRKAQVTNWAHRAPSNGFPKSVHQVHAGRLWRWPDIEKWYRGYVPQRQKTKPGRLA